MKLVVSLFLLFTFFSAKSQCPIPVGKKSFSKVEYYKLEKNPKTGKIDKVLDRTSNTSLTIEIAKNSSGSQGDYFVISGAWLSGKTQAEYIREWNCNDMSSVSSKQYSFKVGDPSTNKYTWYLVVGYSGNFFKAFISIDNSMIVFSD